ncbi:MAG: RluA family pseudouridine synthase [Victivallales bacterium]|nr:RluA family pseudouridine synthase [Victivallales bacterium]
MTQDSSERKETILVPDDATPGMRIDSFLANNITELSRSVIKALICTGKVLYDGKACKPSDTVRPGATLLVSIPVKKTQVLIPQDIALNIIYEDDYLLVLNKQPGIVVHPGNGNDDGTVVNALLHYMGTDDFLAMVDDDQRPGIVHRLDRDTSGALIVAKRSDVRERLCRMFQEHEIRKTYLALIIGRMDEASGMIDLPIGRHPHNPTLRMVVANGKGREACTEYKTIATAIGAFGKEVSLMKIRLHTGRTHQIRVHFAHFGHPVLGDSLYYGCPAKMPYPAKRQLLHAWRLAFRHPVTGLPMKIEAQLPDDFMDAIKELALPVPPTQCPQVGENR